MSRRDRSGSPAWPTSRPCRTPGKILSSGVNHLSSPAIDAGTWNGEDCGHSRKLAVSETAKRPPLGGPGRGATSRSVCGHPANRYLRTSLSSLLSPRITLDRSVRGEVRSAYRRLDGVSRVRLKGNTFGQVQLGGQRRVYHHLLSVCWLLYRSSIVDEKTGRTAFRDFRRDKATMWRLFEDFVTGFYEREQQVYRVNPGGRRIQWADPGWKTDAERAHIPVMDADVILESSERRIILDTKFYRDDARPRTRLRRRQAALEQPLPTARYLRKPPGPSGRTGHGTRACCLPAGGRGAAEGRGLAGGVSDPGRTVDLDQDWRQIPWGDAWGVVGGGIS